jgi:uncharacterized protein
VKYVKFFLIGLYFGIVLVKSEVVSWFRIQEMFHFQSIHMYGVLALAIAVGLTSVLLIRVFKLKSLGGETIDLAPKPFNRVGNVAGGIIFGFGWALTGACPGPLYALAGAGYTSMILAILASLAGVVTYGYLKPGLPH